MTTGQLLVLLWLVLLVPSYAAISVLCRWGGSASWVGPQRRMERRRRRAARRLLVDTAWPRR